MASCRVDRKRALTEHFKQRAVTNFCAISKLTPTETWEFLVNIIVGKRVLGRLFSTSKSDFGKVVRTSAMLSGVGDPVILATELSTFKSQLRFTRFQKREELKFVVRSAVAKFDVDFHKNGVMLVKSIAHFIWQTLLASLMFGASQLLRSCSLLPYCLLVLYEVIEQETILLTSYCSCAPFASS